MTETIEFGSPPVEPGKLPSIATRRHRVDFPGMHRDEYIAVLLRRHWSVVGWRFLRSLLLLALPAIAFLLFQQTADAPTIDSTAPLGIGLTLGASLYVLIVWLLLYHDWLDYYLDALIMTNERLVRIEQRGLFHRTISDLPYERVQDVSVDSKGVGATFLRYGTITIQSAAEQARFTFSAMPNPELVKAEILRLVSLSQSERAVDVKRSVVADHQTDA